MGKSGVEYLAAHPGWKMKRRKARSVNSTLADTLRGAASALEHGRNATADRKIGEVTNARGLMFHKATRLDASDVATILAALREFQKRFEGCEAADIMEAWPDHFTATAIPLSTDDIDDLCERINCSRVLVIA